MAVKFERFFFIYFFIPHPLQVPVPAVLQRRPDASGELGLQHGGPPAARPAPGQHHAARQPATAAVDAAIAANLSPAADTRGRCRTTPASAEQGLGDKLRSSPVSSMGFVFVFHWGAERRRRPESPALLLFRCFLSLLFLSSRHHPSPRTPWPPSPTRTDSEGRTLRPRGCFFFLILVDSPEGRRSVCRAALMRNAGGLNSASAAGDVIPF